MVLWLALATALCSLLVGKVERLNGWDETYYLGQLSSVVEDGDLDLRNDALWSSLPPLELRRMLLSTLPSGNLANTFSIGPAVAFAPAYVVGLAARCWPGAASARWSLAQVAALHMLALALAFWVLHFLYCWLRRGGVPQRRALLGTVALAMGTPFLIYGFRHYAGSHLVSTVAVCAFVAAAHALAQRPDARRAAVCGVFLGFVFLARWQDVVVALALLVPALALRRARVPAGKCLLLAAALIATFAVVASLQLHAWSVERGQLFAVPQGAGYLDLGRPQIAKFLFSGLSGFVPWSPLVLLCLAGLLLPWRLRLPRAWGVVALVIVVLEIYLNACVADWWGGVSYGARRMTSMVPFLALGLGNVLVQEVRRRGWWFRLAPRLLLAACLWGTVTAQLYRRGVQDLTPLFFDRPAAGAQESGVPTPPDRASVRRALGFPFSLHVPDYLDARPSSQLVDRPTDNTDPMSRLPGRLLGALAMLATLAGAARWAGSRRRPRRARPRSSPFPRASILGLGAALVTLIVIAFHARLVGTGAPDRDSWASWRRFASAAGSPAPDHALLDREMRRFEKEAAAAPDADAYRYLYLWSLWQRNRAGRAQSLLQPLAARGYPAARTLVEWGAAAGANGTIRLALPGRLLGRADSELRLHLRGERALEIRGLVVTADLMLPQAGSAELPVLALLAGSTVVARLHVAGDISRLQTTTIVMEGPVDAHGWRGARSLRFTWDGPTETVTVTAGAPGRAGAGRAVSTPLSALGAAPADFTHDDLELVIAPEAVPGGGAGIAIANLVVATAPR